MHSWLYTLSWMQNMGNGRGIPIKLSCYDWEGLKFVWKTNCKDKLNLWVRDVKACYIDPKDKKEIEFDPYQPWPRQPFC